jgi:hypothetical protein
MVVECQTASKNILNKNIREYVVVYMRVAGLTDMPVEQTIHFIYRTPHLLLEEYFCGSN